MPHRTTYIFPRQFPERGLDESSKQQLLDHEKKKLVKSIKSDTFGIESDLHKKSPLSSSQNKNDVVDDDVIRNNHSALSDHFSGGGGDGKFRNKHKKIAAFCDWLVDKKDDRSGSGHRRLSSSSEDERSLLLTPETAKGTAVDRQFSLPRLSSGSSYAGSLFSGTTLDGNFSSDVIKDETSSSRTAKEEEEEEKERLAQKYKESYILQLMLAKRLTCLASLVTEPVLTLSTETWDAETVSYRLWVSGCLSYSDKISDGFYNILGMNPYLWVMCNEVEEGRKMPTLMALKAIEPSEACMEVVLIDRHEDSRLKMLQDKAQELYCANSENTLVLVQQLGKLVAICMGGTSPVEQGNLHKRWKLVSKRLRSFHKCVVLPLVASLQGFVGIARFSSRD